MSVSFPSVDLEKGILATLAQRRSMEAPVLVEALAETITSGSKTEKHEYMSDAPQMSLFEGARKTTPLTDKSTTITNRVYDAAVRLKRDDIRRSAAGGGQFNLTRQLGRLIDTVLGFPNKRMIDLIVNGTSTTAGENLPYDGVSFFNDAHPALDQEGGTQDNLLAGSGITVANLQTDINTAITTFLNFKATNGEPFFGDLSLQLVFLYPPVLDLSFKTVLNATQIGDTTNVQTAVGRPLMSSRFTDPNDWYAFVVNPNWRPFIWQDEQALEVDMTAEDSDLWKQHREAEVGVSESIGAGYAYWQSAIKFVNT